jgi:hypothetical protein
MKNKRYRGAKSKRRLTIEPPVMGEDKKKM